MATAAAVPDRPADQEHRGRQADRYEAVLFDLLSALVDSWSLWDAVAGDRPTDRAPMA